MNSQPVPTLLTVSQFSARHPAFPEGGLRSLLFFRDQNGLAACGAVIKIGRKLLIDEERFFAWARAQQEGGPVRTHA